MANFGFDAIANAVNANSSEKLFSDMDRERENIQQRIESRRVIMQEQLRADELKAQICKQIQVEKDKVFGLKEKIALLEQTDPELFKYIRKLEFIQDGIWCPRCNIPKVVATRKSLDVGISPSGQDDVDALHAYEAAIVDRIRNEYESVEQRIIVASNALEQIKNESMNKLRELISQISSLESEMLKLRAKSIDIGKSIGHSPNIIKQDMDIENIIVNKEQQDNKKIDFSNTQLPPKPSFDLDKLIDDTFSAVMKSDDLLA